MAKIVIFGMGDIARLAKFYFTNDSKHTVAAFTVDESYRQVDFFQDLPCVDFETVEDRFPPVEHKMFVALSYAKMNKVRAVKYSEAKAKGYDLVSYVSSRCSFLTQYQIGDNCFILEDNTIQPFVRIGNDVTVWSGNHIGHHSIIEDHCFLAPRCAVSGNVHIQPYCFVGINATLRNSINIARESLIGAGAVIMNDTVEKGVYMSTRADLIEKNSDQIEL